MHDHPCSLVLVSKLSLLQLLVLLILASISPSFLSFELGNLDLAFPILVLTGLFDAVVSLLDEVEWLWHVLLVLDELLEFSLLL